MPAPSIRQRPRPRAARRGHLDATASHPTAPAAEPAAPRHDARIAAGLNALAGIWLIIAPFVLGYGDGDPYWNDIVFGALVLAIAVLRYAVAPRAAWLSALNMLIGAW